MSIEVPISQLSEALRQHPFGYLITVGDDGRVHVLALRPRLTTTDDGAVIRFVTDSRRTSTNVGAHPDVTVVFPPAEPGAMSLIVDGTAVSTESGIDVSPTWAVLHRDAPSIGPDGR